VADVLRGAVNPSGKLPDTFAVRSDSAPSMVNFGVHLYTNHSQSGAADALGADDKGDWYLVESESIYNGYKYYETRYEDAVLGQANAASNAGTDKAAWNYGDEVVYPFGYGLSYTNFEQTLKSVDLTVGGEGKAVVTVKNTGDVAGKSVVELYVQAPYKQGGLEKSAVQLVAFEKTALLEPGASEDVTVTAHVPYLLEPSVAVARMVAVPSPTAVTLPVWETVATDVSELDHVSDLFVALEGRTVAERLALAPTFSERVDGETVTDVTLTSPPPDASCWMDTDVRVCVTESVKRNG
jgi:hypothetical protein